MNKIIFIGCFLFVYLSAVSTPAISQILIKQDTTTTVQVPQNTVWTYSTISMHGKVTPNPYNHSIGNKEVLVTVTYPLGNQEDFWVTLNEDGTYKFEYFLPKDGYAQGIYASGVYRFKASFQGNTYYNASSSSTMVFAKIPKGMGIVVGGLVPNENRQNYLMNMAIDAFTTNDIPNDFIRVLVPNVSSVAQGAFHSQIKTQNLSLDSLKTAITSWAKGVSKRFHVDASLIPLNIYMVGLNDPNSNLVGTIKLNNSETFHALHLHHWLNAIDNDYLEEEQIIPSRVIIEAPKSGGFTLAGKTFSRTIVTSTGNGQEGFPGNSNIADGGNTSFTKYFMSEISQRMSFGAAYNSAAIKIKNTFSNQAPMIEATGDGTHDNFDEVVANGRILSFSPFGTNGPIITNLNSSFETQVGREHEIWADCFGETGPITVYALITPPDHSSEASKIIKLEKRSEHLFVNKTAFNSPGKYKVTLVAGYGDDLSIVSKEVSFEVDVYFALLTPIVL
ncbi:MAG: hypothetical protein ISR65_17995 [Bacteriovoracaceae bacterium]|nr:hypothetical protein [Bacteriovoracaceae bacterium]